MRARNWPDRLCIHVIISILGVGENSYSQITSDFSTVSEILVKWSESQLRPKLLEERWKLKSRRTKSKWTNWPCQKWTALNRWNKFLAKIYIIIRILRRKNDRLCLETWVERTRSARTGSLSWPRQMFPSNSQAGTLTIYLRLMKSKLYLRVSYTKKYLSPFHIIRYHKFAYRLKV